MTSEADRLHRYETAMSIMVRYGQAYRGDWNMFDGRALRNEIDELADYADSGTQSEFIERQFKDKLFGMLCWREGSGHWTDYCNSYGCEPEDA